MPDKLWKVVEDIVKEEAKNNLPKASRKKKTKCLSEETKKYCKQKRDENQKRIKRGHEAAKCRRLMTS